jgi:hypothetical protein
VVELKGLALKALVESCLRVKGSGVQEFRAEPWWRLEPPGRRGGRERRSACRAERQLGGEEFATTGVQAGR